MKTITIIDIAVVHDKTITLDLNIKSVPEIAKFLKEFIGPTDREHLVMVALNARGRVVAVNEISVGTVSASIAHPREIFKPAILANASAIIIAHNHPSNEVDPSEEDKKLTERVKQAGNILGITCFDHLVVGDERFFSMENNAAYLYPIEKGIEQ